MMLLTLTPRKANDAALKPVILAAEKLGTKVARSPISRGAAWLMSDESTADTATGVVWRSEEHTSELQSLMRISYAVFCLKKKKRRPTNNKKQNKSSQHRHKNK